MPIQIPAKEARAIVKDELRETMERVAARGAMRLNPIKLRDQITRQAATATPSPALPPVPFTRTAAIAPAPTPAQTLFTRRNVSLGGMESTMRTPSYQTYQNSQLGATPLNPFQTAAFRQAVTRRISADPTPPAPVSYVGGYPTIREEEAADWTTYAMIAAAVVVVGGGVYYAKRKKMF
jgi:hypothetical protein